MLAVGIGGSLTKWSTKDFQGSEKTLYDIIKMDTYYTFLQTYRIYNTKSESHKTIDFGWLWCVNVGSSVIAHVPTWVDVNNGEGYACVEAENIWEISVSSSQFCWEAKTALKKVLNWKILTHLNNYCIK